MHVEQLPSGSWRAKVKVDGRQRTATAPTREAAKRRGAQLVVEMGGEPDKATTTVGDLISSHLAEQGYAPSSLANFHSVIKKLPGHFLDRPVQTVTPRLLDGLYAELLRGTGVHQVRKIHVLLSSAFSRARRWGLVVSNPARDARPPAEPESEVIAPTTVQARAFIAAADDISAEFGLFVRVAAIVGSRRGETCGLQWRDIAGNTLTVQRSVSHTKASGLVVGGTKTKRKGVRAVAIPTSLADRFALHQLEQADAAGAVGIKIKPTGWVFTADYVNPWHPSSASHLAYAAREAAGLLDEIQLRHLRNYVVTEMLAAGYSLKQTGGRVGHSKTSTTGDRYQAWVPAQDQTAADMLGAHLLGS